MVLNVLRFVTLVRLMRVVVCFLLIRRRLLVVC